MKKFLSVFLTILLVVSVIPTGLFSITASAETNTDGYIKIYTVADLYCVRNDLTANYVLMNDIDLTEATAKGGDYDFLGNGWNPIGSNDIYGAEAFRGTFDGNGYKVIGLRIEISEDITDDFPHLGLFAKVTGTVKNLIIEGGSISYSVTNSGTPWIGGLCGEARGNIINVSCKLDSIRVKKSGNVGGIVGFLMEGNVEKSQNHSNVTLYTETGSCSGKIGGIAGYFCDGSIANSFNSGDISSDNQGQIGGIAGYVWALEKSSINNCYNSGNIKCDNTIGVGESETSYASGGIVGHLSEGLKAEPSSIKNCYSSTNTARYGIAYISSSGIISKCYYLKGSKACSGATELSKAQMLVQNIYNGFDFANVWTMGGDEEYLYPELQCFTLSGAVSISGNAVYDSIVAPDISKIENPNNYLEYNWYVDDAFVSSDTNYKVKADDVGRKLIVKVKSTYPFSNGVLYSEEVLVGKAKQKELPTIPEILAVDDDSIEITTFSTQEYSIDNVNWQSTGVFDNLDPNKKYKVYSRILENDLYALGNSTKVLEVMTDKRAIFGIINISGTSRYGDVLTADVSGVLPEKATYDYEWVRNGNVVGSGNTYTITASDIGNDIMLTVKGKGDFCSSLTSAIIVPTKAIVQPPKAPVVLDKTNTSVALISNVGYEYSKDKITWQDSSVFTGLSAATEYTFYQRTKETEVVFVSEPSSGTTVNTLKNTVLAPLAPMVENITNTSVTLTKFIGYEYSKDGLTWQTNNVFTGLKPNTSYLFRQRVAETNIEYASAQSEITLVTTLKNSVSAPHAPTVLSATDTSVTLTAIDGFEYSLDGVVWQKDNVFNGLKVLNIYNFYQRIAETDTDFASPSSDAVIFKVKNVTGKTQTPILIEKNNNTIIVEAREGCLFSIDGINWVSNNIFVGLSPNTTYSIYCKFLENNTHYAGDTSDALIVTTLKNIVTKPSAPIVSSFTDTTVTLIPNTAYEYSKDGTTWQTSNVFSGLSSGTKYTFYQRYAETDTHEASDKSSGTSVTTDKSKQTLIPDAPTVQGFTASSITLTHVDGCEYSKDGTIWQSSNVFSGLSCGTEYTFYQRYKETTTTYAGNSSAALVTRTDKGTQHAPSAPTLSIKTHNSVTLTVIDGYEYSRDGTNWQTSNVFTGLNPETNYMFYQRKAETDTHYASASSMALIVKTAEAPACTIDPTLHIYDNNADSDCNNCGYIRELISGWLLNDGEWSYYESGLKATGWRFIGSAWYWFNEGGVMLTGWQYINNTWYYFGDSGNMLTGWQYIGSSWYYFAEGGNMVTGWQYIGSSWYYFHTGGNMATGWLNLGGTWYYLAEGGNMLTGWQSVGGIWYYFHAGGNMATGWLLLGNTWYYLSDGGAMLTGWHYIGGYWYYFNSYGAWVA